MFRERNQELKNYCQGELNDGNLGNFFSFVENNEVRLSSPVMMIF